MNSGITGEDGERQPAIEVLELFSPARCHGRPAVQKERNVRSERRSIPLQIRVGNRISPELGQRSQHNTGIRAPAAQSGSGRDTFGDGNYDPFVRAEMAAEEMSCLETDIPLIRRDRWVVTPDAKSAGRFK